MEDTTNSCRSKTGSLGWTVIPFKPDLDLSTCNARAITEYPTDNGPADYALVLNGQIVGIVEAKKLSLGPQNVLTHAERYARGLQSADFNFAGLRAPFLYSTNGEVIWFHDVRASASRSRPVTNFHTPAALSEMLGRDFQVECARLKRYRTSTVICVPTSARRTRRSRRLSLSANA